MRVLWLVRENLTRQAGGDTVQILATATALRRRGVVVDLSHDRDAEPAGYDLVHLFHLDRLWENESHGRRLRARRTPAVLSPIYWPSDEFDRAGRVGLQGFLARVLGSESYRSLRLLQQWGLECLRRPNPFAWRKPPGRFRSSAESLLRTVAVLLPNSRAEQEQIERYFGVCPPSVIVPNAADAEFYRPAREPWPHNRKGVLCVGRIEPRKNQLAVIRALAGTGIPLTLVGRPGRYTRGYFRRCRREAGPTVRFVDFQGPAELRDLYRSALVHVCASWYETPGLVNLEAALCDCAIAATPHGCVREYLGDGARYCRPDDPASIRAAIETASLQGPVAGLRDRIARDYTWEAAASKTLEAYRFALGGRLS